MNATEARNISNSKYNDRNQSLLKTIYGKIKDYAEHGHYKVFLRPWYLNETILKELKENGYTVKEGMDYDDGDQIKGWDVIW